MNLLLLTPEEIAGELVYLPATDRRAIHLLRIVKVVPGDHLEIGVLGGNLGFAEVIGVEQDALTLRPDALAIMPPPPLPLTLVLALPRPKMLRRTLQSAVSLGIKRICVCHARKVDKSYWQSPYLSEAAMFANTILGLEQSMDTQLPVITLHQRFKPFVEDELPVIAQNSRKLLGAVDGRPSAAFRGLQDEAVTLAVGPEGGFIPYEVEHFIEAGFEPVSLGQRVLRVETALPALVGALLL
ncbi:16S rRNA (uracil(1498)-N(3))-methyltransferase [Allohahella marinimesophila]|uniref:Ribosomal RNA small subunit methyltransferase E n=1 Tax=Allohahella marinimesophila TaxID=1054972 RepID=A0ABP7PKI0_9GAMM